MTQIRCRAQGGRRAITFRMAPAPDACYIVRTEASTVSRGKGVSVVKRIGIVVLSVLAGVAVAASPAAAKHKSSSAPKVSCQQVKDAAAGGKSEADVAKDLGTSDAHVKSCLHPAPKKKKTAKKAM